MSAELCPRCGEVAQGHAFIGDKRYCHEETPSCYELAQQEAEGKFFYLLMYEWPGGYEFEGIFTTRDKAGQYAVAKYPGKEPGRDGVPWPLSIKEVPLDPEN